MELKLIMIRSDKLLQKCLDFGKRLWAFKLCALNFLAIVNNFNAKNSSRKIERCKIWGANPNRKRIAPFYEFQPLSSVCGWHPLLANYRTPLFQVTIISPARSVFWSTNLWTCYLVWTCSRDIRSDIFYCAIIHDIVIRTLYKLVV